ncbi:MAG: hypothetical protein OEZ34_11605, partial [Spirochaetia bacterium]|nr:hypothetical protein [Spirochaetia bacterium]
MKYRNAIALAVLFLLLSSAAYGNPHKIRTERIVYNNSEYIIYYKYNSGDIKNSVIDFFDDLYNKEKSTLFHLLNLRDKNEYKIAIAENADIFSALTGRNWHTASLIDKQRKILYLQNILSLKKNNMLDRVLRHELCHMSFDESKKENFVLEESFCEGFSSVDSHKSVIKTNR